MAATTTDRTDRTDAPRVGVEDLYPVGSRVSWAAILAGAVVALSAYLVLTLLGGAIGLTVSDTTRAETLQTGAGLYAVFTAIAALFVGGWVTSQAVVGENKTEAVVHGVIMWGVVLAMILWLVSAGVQAGFGAMWGVAAFADPGRAAGDDWRAGAVREGVPAAEIDAWRQTARGAASAGTPTATDEERRRAARDTAIQASWYTLLGTMLSMAAAVGGALAGAGPSFRLLARPAGASGRVGVS